MKTLENFLPPNALPFLERWLTGHSCQIKLTRERRSKLGDYRKLSDKTHKISINVNLDTELFFFVMTHEVAHLLAFHQYKNITPHGKEWKLTFRNLLLESLDIYSENLRPLILDFSKNPKANFMSSPALVKYFDTKLIDNQHYVEDLVEKEKFIFQSQKYEVEEKKKKRYLCKNLHTGRKYWFKACARVEKLEQNE